MWPILIGAGVLLAFMYYRNGKKDQAAANGSDPLVSPAASAAGSVLTRAGDALSRTGASLSGDDDGRELVQSSVATRAITVTTVPGNPVGEPVEQLVAPSVTAPTPRKLIPRLDTEAERTDAGGEALAAVPTDMSSGATSEGLDLSTVETGSIDLGLRLPTVDGQGPEALAGTSPTVAHDQTDPDPFIG